MIIFRAIFWLGLVALLMPHQPDLGLGRPGAGVSLPSVMTSRAVAGLSSPAEACDKHRQACAGGLALLDSFQGQAVRGLSDVRTEIENYRKAHKDQAL